MATLADILMRLAPTVLIERASCGDPAGRVAASAVLFDGTDVTEIGRGDLVLWAGRPTPELLAEIAKRQPAAVVMRGPIPQKVLDSDEVPMLELREGGSWMTLARMLDDLLHGGEHGQTAGDGDDLFAVADAVAAVVDAPVTIEDPQSRVLAFSGRQDEADPARMATILGREAPREYLDRMTEHGVFKRLREAAGPIFVSGRPPNVLPRVVAPVRAGGEFLGSVWAAVKEPLSEERMTAFGEAARMVTLHLLRRRSAIDARRSSEVETVRRIIDGSPDAAEAAERAGLSGRAFVAIAAGVRGTGEVEAAPVVSRLADLLRLNLSSSHRRAVIAHLGDVVMGVLSVRTSSEEHRVPHATAAFLEQMRSEASAALRNDVLMGIGSLTDHLAGVPASASHAMRALQTLRSGTATFATIEDVGASVLKELAVDAAAREPTIGAEPMRILREYDEVNGTRFVETVDAWLRFFGDTEAAASMLGVHPNTIRYRIRGIRTAKLVDLDDADVRLALMLHLELARRS